MDKIYLCIHGHFYQPPRENPWIEEIEAQNLAGGAFHDWNERISSECYRPNAFTRILDADQKIDDIVNNYEYISFNFGPTLLSWLEKYDARTYERILEADRVSIKKHGGHGNALAQAYNHMIMPLATRRDKITQIRWGISDFEKRFGRSPEGMWLPETACNDETLEVLIEEGIKFTILSPHQAEKIKGFADEEWKDVSKGEIDPTQSYRFFVEKRTDKFIDIFFYDGPISKAVAFDDLVCDAKIYADKLTIAKNLERKHAQLISVATDGETYGHHKAFGDRALAYLLQVEAPSRGFTLTNYAEFLEKFPPQYEVKLKAGENNLGTSWSCAHGVKRWMDQCGCRGGGPAHWRQDWRKPLRESFDWLRDELSSIFEKEGNLFLKDVWAARNDYINIVLDRGPESHNRFFEKHAVKKLTPKETSLCLKLLEMQRNLMLMYTSCGWFFTELSGEETVQVIKYASRALQLAENVSGRELTVEFTRHLAKARSNMAQFRDGLGIYEDLVRPSVVTLEKVVAHFAISSLFHEHTEEFAIYCYEFNDISYRREEVEDLALCFGRLKVRSKITREELDAVYVLLQSELYDFYCYVKPFEHLQEYHTIDHELFSEFALRHRNRAGEIIELHFGKDFFSLKDLFREEKQSILEHLSKDGLDRFKELYEEICGKHRRMFDVYRMARIPLPEEFYFAFRYELSTQFNNLINEKLFTSPSALDKATEIYVLAKEADLTLNKAPAAQFLQARLHENILGLSGSWDDKKIINSGKIMTIVNQLEIEMDLRLAQEYYLAIAKRLNQKDGFKEAMTKESLQHFLQLGEYLSVDIEKMKVLIDEVLQRA